MKLEIKAAVPEEFDRVLAFYYDTIDKMQGSKYHPKWQKGVYPEDEYIRSSIGKGQLYTAVSGYGIVGAMILNSDIIEGYEKAAWSINAAPEEVFVIHALGVLPDFARNGIGKFMVGEAIKIAGSKGIKTLRLDVIDGNLPAEKLYKSMGFSFVERVTLYYEDTGWEKFDLYEYVI